MDNNTQTHNLSSYNILDSIQTDMSEYLLNTAKIKELLNSDSYNTLLKKYKVFKEAHKDVQDHELLLQYLQENSSSLHREHNIKKITDLINMVQVYINIKKLKHAVNLIKLAKQNISNNEKTLTQINQEFKTALYTINYKTLPSKILEKFTEAVTDNSHVKFFYNDGIDNSDLNDMNSYFHKFTTSLYNYNVMVNHEDETKRKIAALNYRELPEPIPLNQRTTHSILNDARRQQTISAINISNATGEPPLNILKNFRTGMQKND